jgi:thiamine-monophosphate kinase
MGDVDHRWTLVFLGAPPGTPLSFLNDLYRGVRGAAKRFGVVMAGGDTVKAAQLTLVAAAGGVLKGKRPLTRRGARVGDVIGVAGLVGDAAVGLSILDGKARVPARAARYFARRFFEHVPLLDEGAFLARTRGVTAAMDLSDPLDRSCQILFTKNGLGADVFVDRIPCSAPYRRARGVDTRLLRAGEDYALLFTASKSAAATLTRRRGIRLIGQVTRGASGVRYFLNGKPVEPGASFDHF